MFVLLAAWLAIAEPPLLSPPPPVLAEAEGEIGLDTAFDRVQRMTVNVEVNGVGPYPFVVDTGADRSVVSGTLADELRLEPSGSVVMHGIAGVETVNTVRVDRLRVGGKDKADIRAPVLSRANLGATGLLGVDALANRRVVLDFKAQRMTIGASAAREPRRDGNTIIVTARRRFGQLILTDASIDGRKVYAVIDTGAENTIGNSAFRKLLFRRRSALPSQPTTLISVTGRTVAAEATIVPLIRIGGMDVRTMPIAIADLHTFKKFGLETSPAILLGMDVLRTFERVAIDFGKKKVRFRLLGSVPAERAYALQTMPPFPDRR